MTSIAFDRLVAALESPRGALQLGALAACVALAWLADHLVSTRFGRDTDRRGGRIALGAFPIALLALVLLVRAGFKPSGPTHVLDLAIPLVVALAVIRLLVYVMRRLFANAPWVKSSERAIAFAIWAILALHYLGVTAEVNEMLERIVVPLGKQNVSVFAIGQGFLVVLVAVATTLWLSSFVEKRLMALEFDINARVVLSKFLRAFFVVVGVLISLPAIGVDLTLLSVFGGALGVGIGLGLQKLASNYIAGFTILLDKSIRVGDTITVDGRQGRIVRVTSRYVVVRSNDGVDAIVPNETLVTTTVLNHPVRDERIRIVTPVLVAHGTDVARALSILVEAALAEPRVLREPGRAPDAYATGVGEMGTSIELAVWIADPQNGQVNLRSSILARALSEFAAAGFPSPTRFRDLRPESPPGGAPAIPPGS